MMMFEQKTETKFTATILESDQNTQKIALKKKLLQ